MRRTLLSVLAVVACAGCSQSAPSAAPSTAPALTSSEAAPAPQAPAQPAAAEAPAKSLAVSDGEPAPPESTPTQVAATAKPRTAAKPVVAQYADDVPTVLLTAAERAQLKVGVGDQMPAIELPKREGGSAPLESLAGEQATVVLFWGADRWMSHTALADLAKEVAGAPDRQGVNVVGVAVGLKVDAVAAELEKSGAKFPQLLDADGRALAQLGAPKLPRVYVLDAAGKIAWFDVEYSEATRRDLHATLAALAPPQ